MTAPDPTTDPRVSHALDVIYEAELDVDTRDAMILQLEDALALGENLYSAQAGDESATPIAYIGAQAIINEPRILVRDETDFRLIRRTRDHLDAIGHESGAAWVDSMRYVDAIVGSRAYREDAASRAGIR